ncbi:cytochrome P450 6B1-like [Belonocnema kinseyi]|uniref:cytochrome P450 6B1-like n=1 Tax=Belonocnema kinseyi TaxID=2817044 RepID=UPI00143D9112|nr:cytochrome P450 6B1-like [Belonocnema kinseyi]
MELIFVLACVTSVVASIYYYLKCQYNFWQKQGIPYARGIIPGLGNMTYVVLLRQSFNKLCENYYKENEKHSMFGFYQFSTPTLLVRDPELVKSVLLTNFASFQENQISISCPKEDALFTINPFFSKMDTWKENRAPLTNAFSSKKLKTMLPLIEEASSRMENYIKQKMSHEREKLELNFKTFFNLYTGEIAAAGMGIQGHNFDDDSISLKSELTFKTAIETVFSAPFFTGGFSQIILMFMPRLAKILNMTLLPKEVDLFYRQSVKNILANRKRDNRSNNDFLKMIVDHQLANGLKINEETALASHMLSFSVEVYETSAITLSFLCFQLASHPEIQERVREEIKSLLEKYDGKLNYEAYKEMTYLDQVLNESMRLNHVSGIMTKVCTREIQLVGSDGLSCKVKPGHVAVISTFGLQMDPKYWPEPEKFDPDRFGDEKKEKIHKFTFIPFGEGPRICVGMRMANIIIKIAVATIVKNYSLEVSPKTPLPLKRDEASFMTAYENGLWVFLKPLKHKSS